MVGEGVLHECLHHADVEKVLVISRKPCGIKHAKLEEIVHGNFFDLSPIENQLSGYNACYFCLGVSSVGMKEETYHHLTFDLTISTAQIIVRRNHEMTFCYVSGSGTDSTEKGKTMWARVKGKTENALLQMPFRQAFMFRPGYMQPTPGLKNALKFYKALGWLYPVMRLWFPRFVTTLAEVGKAMINCTKFGYDKPVLEVPDILAASKRA
jgi:hypothetical protein